MKKAIVLFSLFSLLPASLLRAAEPDKSRPVRYLKRAGGKFVLESEITEAQGAKGSTYISRTVRPGEQMTLTLQFDKKQKLISARVVQEMDKTSRSAKLTFQGTSALLTRPGKDPVMLAKIAPNVVVTTAPDWSDIFQLIRRYDQINGGRQEFPGLWIHPVKDTLRLTFSIERVGVDKITSGKGPKNPGGLLLSRYKIHLRSGDYLAWADSAGRVYKLMAAGKPATSVVRDGWQHKTGRLGK
jgi:hypothetical protein